MVLPGLQKETRIAQLRLLCKLSFAAKNLDSSDHVDSQGSNIWCSTSNSKRLKFADLRTCVAHAVGKLKLTRL